jgi:hypothetical protein
MADPKKFRAKNVAILDVAGTNVLDVDDDKEIRVKVSNGTNQLEIDSDKRQTVKITGGDNANQVDVISVEGQNSLRVVQGLPDEFSITLDAENLTATTGLMLIDLSDTTNWPHTETDHIIIKWVNININPSSNFEGDVELGFLQNVDADNGDFHVLKTWHFERASDSLVDFFNLEQSHLEANVNRHFGPVVANDTTWQTDVNLQGPDGDVSYPSGNGDVTVKAIINGGSVDIGIAMGYITI